MIEVAKIGAMTSPAGRDMLARRPVRPWGMSDMTSARMRGRAGQKARARRMAAHPTCAECERLGFTVPTEEIDHIVALAKGGLDIDSNVQGLCCEHHAAKSAAEDASHAGAMNHPTWLQRSRVPLAIICGPPGSGKSGYTQERAGPHDIVIDLDRIIARLTGQDGHQRGKAHLDPAIRARNQMLGALARSDAPRAFFVVSAPYPAERQWWSDILGGSVVLMDPGERTCMARIQERGTPWQAAAVARWYRNAKAPWVAPEDRPQPPAIRLDGRPEGWGDE